MSGLNATRTEFDAENDFYRLTRPHRIGKLMAHWATFIETMGLPGAIVECGVFKGSSFYRWALFRSLIGSPWSRQLIGFDTFSTYAVTEPGGRDFELRDKVVADAGARCATEEEIRQSLYSRRCHENVILVPGRVEQTIPEFVATHPELKISILNLDLDFYEGSRVVLEHLWPRVVRGGIMLVDDYGVFEGETRAIDELGLNPLKPPYCYSPCVVTK